MNGSISESITVKVFQKVICSDWLFPSNCVKKKIKDLGSLRESFNNYKIEHPNNNLFERIKHPSYFGDKLIRPAMKAMRLVIRAAITPIIFGPVAIVGFFWNVRKFIHLIDLKRKHSISQDLFESQMAKIKPGCVVDGGNSLRFIILAFFIYRINKTRTFSKTNLILGCLSSINVISQIFLGIKPLKFIEALKNTEGLPYFKSRCFHYYFGISDLDGGVLKTDDIKDIEIIENDLSNVINNAAIQWIKTLELIYELQSHLPDSLKLKFFNHLKNKEIKEVLSTLQKAKKITKNYTKIEFYKNWEKRFLQQQEIYSYMNTILFHCHHITVPLQLKSDLEINKEYNKICINVAESYKPFFEIPKEEDLIKVKESIDALDQYDIFKNNSMFIKVKDLVSKLYVDEISDYEFFGYDSLDHIKNLNQYNYIEFDKSCRDLTIHFHSDRVRQYCDKYNKEHKKEIDISTIQEHTNEIFKFINNRFVDIKIVLENPLMGLYKPMPKALMNGNAS